MAVVDQLQRIREIPVKPAAIPAKPAVATLWPRRPEDGLNPAVLARVRPSDWINPQSPGRYDLLVAGGGAAGIAAAEHAASLGVRVALATDEPLGLDILADALPRAVFLRSAGQVCQIRRAAAAAWPEARLGRLDFPSLVEQLAAARQEAAERYAARRLAGRGVAVYLGPMSFTGPNCLKVAGQTLSFSRAILTPVARTTVPEIEGLEQLGYQTPETLGTLAELPRRWAIVGSTTVACELAQAFRRLGSAVDLIIPDGRLLADHEPVVGELLARQFAADGIEVHCGWSCQRGQRTGAAKSLVIQRHGQFKKLLTDEILVAGPRHCDLGWLRPSAAGLAMHGADIRADAWLRTSNARIFSIGPSDLGDALAGEAVEGVARLAVENAMSWRKRPAGELPAASWIRTDPLVCRLRRHAVRTGSLADNGAVGSQADTITSHVFLLPPESAGGAGLTLFGGSAPVGGSGELGSSGWLILRVSRLHRRVVGTTVVGPAARDLVVPLTTILTDSPGSSAFWVSRILKALRVPENASAASKPAWLERRVDEALS